MLMLNVATTTIKPLMGTDQGQASSKYPNTLMTIFTEKQLSRGQLKVCIMFLAAKGAAREALICGVSQSVSHTYANVVFIQSWPVMIMYQTKLCH